MNWGKKKKAAADQRQSHSPDAPGTKHKRQNLFAAVSRFGIQIYAGGTFRQTRNMDDNLTTTDVNGQDIFVLQNKQAFPSSCKNTVQSGDLYSAITL